MPLNPQDQPSIVAAQNAYRSDPAINAPNLQWDSTLATGAQTWADNLATNVHQLQHSDPSMRQGLGENIASATTGSKTPAQMADMWGALEKPYFKPGIFPNVSTDSSKVVGHYTQVIWKTTTNVGCGIATDSTTGNTYLVCRYSPQGNVSGVGVPPPQPVSLVQVSCVSSTNTFGVDAANNVYLYQTSAGPTWTQTQLPGKMKQVSAAADNTVLGLDLSGVIWNFDWNAFNWTQMTGPGGPLAQISCASASNIWGVDSNNAVWQYTTTWTQIQGAVLKNVSAASDGTVWGVGSADNTARKYLGSNAWQMVADTIGDYRYYALDLASVGTATNIWTVTRDKYIWTYNGSSWTHTSPQANQVKQVSVASDGTVWTVMPDNTVFLITPTANTQVVV
jgi:Cysteine-rich secretory protein family/Tectonin domain